MEYQPILKLSDEVIGQIAAGEVVERPAAAVKELVENSIDAGATAVTVELTDGGITAIRVSDNGRGIPASQMKMAFERHATSKLITADDLFSVHTLGFRGEALASIAAVSKVSCISRTKDASFGIRAQVEAGVIAGITEAASPVGTSVTVKELFYNAPVRLKFLKKPAAEAAYVSDYIMRLILSRPDVAFRFVNQGKTIYRSAGDGTLESAIYCVYGKDALRGMRHVSGTQSGLVLDGYIGVGEYSRGNRNHQSFFVNGRFFRDERVSRALETGCEGFVMIGRYPICALALQLPYRQVDVNVHPNKLEVRFQNADAVLTAIESLTKQALRLETVQQRINGEPGVQPLRAETPVQVIPLKEEASQNVVSQTTPENAPSAAIPSLREPPTELTKTIEALQQETDQFNRPQGKEEQFTNASASDASAVRIEELHAVPQEQQTVNMPATLVTAATNEAFQPEMSMQEPVQERMAQTEPQDALRYIGAIFKTFLLFEIGERLLMVDQHAAHERVLYDRYMERYQGTMVSQRLIAPQMVRLTAQDVQRLSEIKDELTDIGFDVEAFDETTVAVRAIPVILGQNEPVRDWLVDFLDETRTNRGAVTHDRLRSQVAQMACKHAIKGGDVLTDADVEAILTQMLETGTQPTCPHGRPIVTEWSHRDLEKRFKRIP